MARTRRKRRSQVINVHFEKEKFQLERKKLLISQDFNEITLAISLLAGIWISTSKIIDYLNNNILHNSSFQLLAYLVLIFLFMELLIILFFILIKGYFISTRNMNRKLSTISQFLLKKSLKYSILFSVLLISKLFADFIYKSLDKNNTYSYQYNLFTTIIIVLFFMAFFLEYILFLISEVNSYLEKTIQKETKFELLEILMQKILKQLKYGLSLKILTQKILLQLKRYEFPRQFLTFVSKKIPKKWIFWTYLRKMNQDKIDKFSSDMNIFSFYLTRIYTIFIIVVLLVTFFITTFFVMPTYLLKDSYSIDAFPISNTNSGILTFTIKETGISYNFIYITLNKLNSGSNLIQYVDNVTINRTNGEAPSNNSLMLGKNYEDIWYLNINTSDLQPGNYILHAEVTDDSSKNNTIFGTISKHAEKLFYIAPNSSKYSFNSTKELNNSSGLS